MKLPQEEVYQTPLFPSLQIYRIASRNSNFPQVWFLKFRFFPTTKFKIS
jgi:hypothetical protein